MKQKMTLEETIHALNMTMPPTPSAVLPKNVRQGAASQVYVRVNGGIVLGD